MRPGGKLRVAIALATITALTAVACGDERTLSGDRPSDGASSNGGAGKATESSGGTLPVGMLLAQTGSGSFYGEVMSAGAKLAAKELEAEGGWTVDISIEDHKSGNAEAGVAGYRKMTSVDGAKVVLSSFTAPTLAVQQLAAAQGVLVLNGGGAGSDLVGKDNLFNTRMLGDQVMPPLLEWAVEEYEAKRVATLVWDDAAGKAIEAAIKQKCEELGCQVVGAEAAAVGATEYGGQLARIKGSNPDLLVLGSYGTDVGYSIAQARRQGLDMPIIGNEWSPDAQEVGGRAMEGYVVATDLFDAGLTRDPEGRAFADAYEAEYGELPEFYAANYYELVRYVIPELIELAEAQGLDPNNPGVLADTLAQAAADAHEFDTVYGDSMKFLEDGTISKPAGIFEVKGGKLHQLGEIVDGKVKVL